MKKTLSGAASGKGAVYEWDGSSKVGAGRMEIVESSPPSQVKMKLDFLRPFAAHNTAGVHAPAQRRCHGRHVGAVRPHALHFEAHERVLQHGQDGRRSVRGGSWQPEDARRKVSDETPDRPPQALAGAHGAVFGRPDDRPRHDDRERRAAVDPRGPRASPRPRWSGSSTRTCSPSAASCCSAAGSATCSATAACSCSASRCSRSHRSRADWRARRDCSSAPRAVQGLGGAVVSAVALSLIMNLFTEPADRAKAMGIYGFVCAGGGSIGVLLGGVLTSALELALDLPRQPPDRRRGLCVLPRSAAG